MDVSYAISRVLIGRSPFQFTCARTTALETCATNVHTKKVCVLYLNLRLNEFQQVIKRQATYVRVELTAGTNFTDVKVVYWLLLLIGRPKSGPLVAFLEFQSQKIA